MNNKKVPFLIVLLVIFISAVSSACYLFFLNPIEERVRWVSSFYGECLDSSQDVERGSQYGDLQDVLQGKYDSERLRFYTNNIDLYFKGNCGKANEVVCEDSYLYVLRSYLVRGNEKDLKMAFSMLDQYKKMQGINIYYDAAFLDVSLYHAWKNKAGEEFYKDLLEQTQNHLLTASYFQKPHQEELCDIYLNYIGVAFSKSGDYAADLYIQYHVKN